MAETLIVTGVKRIGKEVCKHLLGRGYNLAVVYRSSEEQVRELKEVGEDRVLGIRADLTEGSSYSRVVEETVERFGRIDGFVHLASPYERINLEDTDISDIESHMRPITYAFFGISKEAYKVMRKNKGAVKGRIVAFGDWAVERTPYKNYSAYFIAKGALHTAVRVLAKEFAPEVIVNCIALGPVLIPEGMDRQKWERILARTPLKREVSMEDVVTLTEFLLRAESITGEVICLDGGRHIAGSGV